MKKLTLLLLISFLTMSCGFHLRGNQDLSNILPEIKIQGVNKHSELGRELLSTLSSAKVNVSDESGTVLIITQNKSSKRVLSLDSAGRANQYELNYQLEFSLIERTSGDSLSSENLQSDSKLQKDKYIDLIPAQSINEKREYLFDANLVLAKADEEMRLNSDMRQAAILQLIRRLSFSLKKRQSKLMPK